ncbi:DNA/RNA non-specific endonuclease [Comamonas sp. B21-038]|nr:DNA/RNA non-specific endonuclease [Comamonas sp. B21-038]ULR91524.1 DNA/RNA non-specific endonuclease [Comamonas sp. B21-038]
MYSGETKAPIYVFQRLNAAVLSDAQNLPCANWFYPKAHITFAERSQLNDVKYSGWSRGHMAPAGDMSTLEGNAQSFSLANVVPKDSCHNSGAWSKNRTGHPEVRTPSLGGCLCDYRPAVRQGSPNHW